MFGRQRNHTLPGVNAIPGTGERKGAKPLRSACPTRGRVATIRAPMPSVRVPVFVAFLLVLLPGLAGAARPLDTVVAVIRAPGGEGRRAVITLSELELETRVAAISRAGSGAATAPIPPPALASSLDWLVAEYLFLFEAEGLAVAAVEPADVARAVVAFRDRFPDIASYRRFLEANEVTEAELGRILRRSLLVSRYLDSRVRLAVAVTEDDLRRAYEAKAAELAGQSFEEARPLLARSVEQEQREAAVKAMIADLRARGEVRVLHPVAGEGSP
jgi:hypothetical protein